ncbi:MAG: diacylglycerol kinase family protein [Endomicrobiales bacterium]|nr:diacylglycerol kinase family protein [Endomicrobiales bacterium]
MKSIFNFIYSRFCSVRCAINGIATMIKYEHNAWIHGLATITVCAAGVYFKLTSSEWCWIVLAIAAVWTSEALNTALEFLADVASPDFHPMVEKAKDVAAGAVLVCSISAAIIGVFVFGSRLIPLIIGA